MRTPLWARLCLYAGIVLVCSAVGAGIGMYVVLNVAS